MSEVSELGDQKRLEGGWNSSQTSISGSYSLMKRKFCSSIIAAALAFTFNLQARNSPNEALSTAPEFKNLADLKWDKILPDLGENSPEICILHVDPKTHATSLLIRTPKAIHVRKHWHSANETHTMVNGTGTFACNGKKFDLSPGGFNFMPAKMVHEAWLPSNSLTFITVDSAWDVNWVDRPPTTADLVK